MTTLWPTYDEKYLYTNPYVEQRETIEGVTYYVLYADVEYITYNEVFFYNAIIGISQFKNYILMMQMKVEQGDYE